MKQDVNVEKWQRRAVLMHDTAKDLAERLNRVQGALKTLHMEYDRAVHDGGVLTRALNAMSRLANQAGVRHRYCYRCGSAWAVENLPNGELSGASVCDDCLAEHKHWTLEPAEEYKVAT